MFLNLVVGKGRERGLTSKLSRKEISNMATFFWMDFHESCVDASKVLALLSKQLLPAITADH